MYKKYTLNTLVKISPSGLLEVFLVVNFRAPRDLVEVRANWPGHPGSSKKKYLKNIPNVRYFAEYMHKIIMKYRLQAIKA